MSGLLREHQMFVQITSSTIHCAADEAQGHAPHTAVEKFES